MDQTKNILFLCTGNSARSILAECLMNTLGGDRYTAYSAGSNPVGQVHPMALKVLEKRGIDVDNLRSKNWAEFGGDDAPHFDLVVTVCGNARDETCPIWPGSPLSTHWGLEDPAKFDGSTTMQEAHFDTAFDILKRRIKAFLDYDDIPSDAKSLSAIGTIG